MPNRRRRRLSTATSAVAALAVVSPFAISAITDMTKPAPQPREFHSAAMITDLPSELMSALSQGLSQFGINLPSLGSLTGESASTPTTLTAPGSLASPGLTSPLAPGLTTPPAAGLPGATPPLTDPALSSTGLLDPAAAGLGTANPALTNPAPAPAGPAGLPGLTGDATAAATPALNPTLTSPTGAVPGGLTTPPVLGTDPALGAIPISNGAGLPNPGEVPIGLDPAATYPILGGDPGLGLGGEMPAATSGSSGIVGDISTALQNLGANQAIDLLKGTLMPMITSAMKAPAAVPPPPAPEAVPPVPAG